MFLASRAFCAASVSRTAAFTSELGGDLVGVDGEQRLALRHGVALVNVNLAYCATPRHEHFGRSLGRSEIANRGFLARVLRDEQESNESGRQDGKEPGRDLGRNLLERGHIAPLLAMLMKVDGLLAKQGPSARVIASPPEASCCGKRLTRPTYSS